MKPHRPPAADQPPSIRAAYERHGARDFYTHHGATYRNPHEKAIHAALRRAVAEWPLDLDHVLDLACGSGEVTLALPEARILDGIDPYTGDAYRARTDKHAEPWTFDEIAGGALHDRRYSLIVCSFALHLVDPSRLPMLAYQLGRIADALVILTPHKRPRMDPAWGWIEVDAMLVDRVHTRLYKHI
jgi:hypothetical protein